MRQWRLILRVIQKKNNWMGNKRKKGRSINGILLLDKPLEMTSNKALQIVKRIFNANKAGHTGSLDPLATGLLPLCFGEATKVCGYLLDSDKEYEVVCKLGVKTATGDVAGEIIEEKPVPQLLISSVNETMQSFVGEIEQIPPMYSALKKDGKRLYELARKGIQVEREARQLTIFSIDHLSIDDDSISFTVKCSKGTYIRTLVEDIAEKLGTCAHVTFLRRIKAGPFEGANMITLPQIDEIAENGFEELDKLLIGADTALAKRPKLNLTAEMARAFCHGQPMVVPMQMFEGHIRVYDDEGLFIGIGMPDSQGKIVPKRIFNSN